MLGWHGKGPIALPEIYTVSELTAHIKALLDDDRLLRDVWLQGEVSNFKQAASGHCYFTLKDAVSSLRAVIWRTQAFGMALPRDGDAVIAHGYVSVYEAQGVYQLYVDHLQPAGVGLLWQEYERLKARLAAEGLFDEARKRPIPTWPTRVGVVTSPDAAALRDILRILGARYPLVDVVLAPTAVQGEAAVPGIVAAIEALNRWSAEREKLDVIIVARGGGSIEELWAFNDEQVARAIAASQVPVISGVGHETDFTIADFAADERAPTPTAAAMRAVPDAREISAGVAGLVARAAAQVDGRLRAARRDVAELSRHLSRLSPINRLAGNRQLVDDLSRRAGQAIVNRLAYLRQRLEAQHLRLTALDPAAVLTRGYAIVTRADGRVVSSVAHVVAGDEIAVRVADGTFGAEVRPT